MIVLVVLLMYNVALRKESVDRNGGDFFHIGNAATSLSARRAWIEILGCVGGGTCLSGRSPQGERG